MFHKATAPVVEPADTDVIEHPAEDLIPFSRSSAGFAGAVDSWLGLPSSPPEASHFTLDDLGRRSVSRADARQLLDRTACSEAGKAEKRAAAEVAGG